MPEQEQPLVKKGGDNSPSAEATIHDRTGLYVSIIAMVLAALALGMQAVQPLIVDAKVNELRGQLNETQDKATVSENHWRNIEVELKALQNEVRNARSRQ